jgi:hypothetical protein
MLPNKQHRRYNKKVKKRRKKNEDPGEIRRCKPWQQYEWQKNSSSSWRGKMYLTSLHLKNENSGIRLEKLCHFKYIAKYNHTCIKRIYEGVSKYRTSLNKIHTYIYLSKKLRRCKRTLTKMSKCFQKLK